MGDPLSSGTKENSKAEQENSRQLKSHIILQYLSRLCTRWSATLGWYTFPARMLHSNLSPSLIGILGKTASR